jgi:hypothetical protein
MYSFTMLSPILVAGWLSCMTSEDIFGGSDDQRGQT